MGVRMRHPDLEQEIVVPSSAVPIHAGSGWQAVEGQDDMGETLPPELQLFEGQPPVRLYHPDLDTEIKVAESAVPFHRANGWLLIEDEPEVEVADDGLDAKTVPELRELAKTRGISPIPTTKPELLERLRGQQQDQTEPAEAGQPPKEE